MADPNHSIFARIGILYILEIYQWVSPSIKDGYRKVKVDVLPLFGPYFRSVPRLAVSLPVCPYLNIGWVKSLYFC